jgi:hypothetical protein
MQGAKPVERMVSFSLFDLDGCSRVAEWSSQQCAPDIVLLQSAEAVLVSSKSAHCSGFLQTSAGYRVPFDTLPLCSPQFILVSVASSQMAAEQLKVCQLLPLPAVLAQANSLVAGNNESSGGCI